MTGADRTTDDLQGLDVRALLDQVRVDNEADLAAARETLARLAEEHAPQSANLTDATAAAQHMVNDAESILAEVAAAERRLEAGTFGLCQSCGRPIPAGRLELRPYVRTCVDCAR